MRQMGGTVDAFVCAAGTGGTIGGISRYLKDSLGAKTKTYLVDCEGSILYNNVKTGGVGPHKVIPIPN